MVIERFDVSERRACRAIGIHRKTVRRTLPLNPIELELRRDIIKYAKDYGRYGYKRVTGLLRNNGWKVNHKKV